jgi:hypothetical protein
MTTGVLTSIARVQASAAGAAGPELPYDHYHTYEELTRLCRQFEARWPDSCRLSSIGCSREGREIWLLTLTDFATGPPEDKPAYLVYGNIHAIEGTGVHCCLHNAETVLTTEATLLKEVRLLIKVDRNMNATGALGCDPTDAAQVVFYIIPRLAVDVGKYPIVTPVRGELKINRAYGLLCGELWDENRI